MHYILLGFAPGLYWLWYFYQRDKLEPEPKKLIFVSYFLGILSAALVIFINMPFKLDYFVGAVVSAPILEELAKFLMVWAYLYRNKNFSEPMDGIVYDRWGKLKKFGKKMKGKDLYDLGESPLAYKDIDEVIKSELDLIKPLVKLKPLGVVKG